MAIISGIVAPILNGYVIVSLILPFLIYIDMFNLILLLLNIVILIISITILIYLHKSRKKVGFSDETKIRQIILDAGTKFSRIKIKEISEYSNVDKISIIKVIKEMVQNREIYGEYFKNSRTISFNQVANIEEIDNLLESYKKWEEDSIGKV